MGERYFEGMPGPETPSPIVRVTKDGLKPVPFTENDYNRLSPAERRKLHNAIETNSTQLPANPLDQVEQPPLNHDHNGVKPAVLAQDPVRDVEV